MKIKNTINIDFLLSLSLLIFAIGFNLYLYRLEPTAKIDPNDNTFQYALVHRTNQIWDYASAVCPKNIFFPLCHLTYLVDHWVPNWAQGYNLPFYYSHLPQIVIVSVWRFLSVIVPNLSLFSFYHLVIYALLCIFPLPVFLALRVIRLPWLVAGIGAVFASHISTDGLYGLDPPSYLWRGYGLSSQLFAMVWLPLSAAFSFRLFADKPDIDIKSIQQMSRAKPGSLTVLVRNRNLLLSILFTVVTTAGHLGIGVMALLSALVFSLAKPVYLFFNFSGYREIRDSLIFSWVKLAGLGSGVILILGYWIIPNILLGNYHNISVWDPIWKFNSFGWQDVLIKLYNGEIFDFGRFPWLTLFVFIGIYAATYIKNHEFRILKQELKLNDHNFSYFPLSLLFLFWVAMYFGRTTWGGLIDLIPGMSEFHLSRFIVGIHLSGLFLAPIGLWASAKTIGKMAYKLYSTEKITSEDEVPKIVIWSFVIIAGGLLSVPIYKQTVNYNDLNNKLIRQANDNYSRGQADINNLFGKISTLPPGRVYVGRGGGWGKDFNIAETEMFIHISTYGVPTALWLPETWSPNSDTEQYFSEDVKSHYDLYNLRYVAAPPTVKPQTFWKQISKGKNWVLYEVPTNGYFTAGRTNLTVITDKMSYKNLVRLWIQSPISQHKIHLELTFDKPSPDINRNIIEMLDEATYKDKLGHTRNIFTENPLTDGKPPSFALVGPEKVNADMTYKTKIKLDSACPDCLVILKQTYHPAWRGWVNGKPVKLISVFPFHIGVPITQPGTYEVEFAYKPHFLKLPLLLLSMFVIVIIIAVNTVNRRNK